MATLTFHLIFHTHWDREWHLPRAALHARLVGALDDLLDRLGGDPGFTTFLLDGQSVILEDYARARPERVEEIRALVRAGRLQVGPWYVLADEQIPAGESLVRNLLLGAADAAAWGGRLGVLYSPDAFGHPACLPELARGAGMDAAVVWRGLGGAPGQQRDRYRWRGPSGAEIRLWHLPPSGYEIGVDLGGDAGTEAWAWVRGQLIARAAGREIPVFIGADHFAAPPDVSRLTEQLSELERPNRVRISRLDEFFAAAAAEFREAPVLTGPLRFAPGYTWSLQGVHGTRAPLKRRISQLEVWLTRMAEPLAALARRRQGRDYRPALEQAWRTLVQCQFHDTVCGTTSDAAAREAMVRLEAVQAYGDEVVRDAAFDLLGHDPDRARDEGVAQSPVLALWNPAPRPRDGVVIVDCTFFRRDVPVGPPGGRSPRTGRGAQAFSLRGPDGVALPMQVLDRRTGFERLDARRHYPDQDEVDRVRIAVKSPTIPGCATAILTPGAPQARRTEDTAEVQARSLVNRHVVVTLDRTGALLLYDRASGERWLDVLRLESQGDAGDAYTFWPAARDRLVRSQGPIRVRRVARGPLVAGLETTWSMKVGARARGRVGICMTVMLHAESPVVRCILDIDNGATDHRLRARLPTGSKSPAVVGTQFGLGPEPEGPRPDSGLPLEAPPRTAPAHRYLAVFGASRGIACFAPGFFEYERTPHGDVLITLLRAIGTLSRGDLPGRPGHAAWPTATPEAQCLGPMRIELAVAPVTSVDTLPELWDAVFAPVRGVWIRDAIRLSASAGGVTLEGAGLVFSSLKPVAGKGEGMVLRCVNPGDHQAAGAWRFAEPVQNAHRTRLDEGDPVPLVLEDHGHVVRFTLEPHEISTIVVR